MIIKELEKELGVEIPLREYAFSKQVGITLNKQGYIESLSLDSLQIKEIPDCVFELKHLRGLFLGSNSLFYFDKRLAKISSLGYLSLEKNNIHKIDNMSDVLRSNKKLTIALERNVIGSLEPIMDLEFTPRLDLSMNCIRELPLFFTEFNSLFSHVIKNAQFIDYPKDRFHVPPTLWLIDNPIGLEPIILNNKYYR